MGLPSGPDLLLFLRANVYNNKNLLCMCLALTSHVTLLRKTMGMFIGLQNGFVLAFLVPSIS